MGGTQSVQQPPPARDVQVISRSVADARQAEELPKCIDRIYTAAFKGEQRTTCWCDLSTDSVEALRRQGYRVEYIKDDPDWPFQSTAHFDVSWAHEIKDNKLVDSAYRL